MLGLCGKELITFSYSFSCGRIPSSLTTDLCFDGRYAGKQPVDWELCRVSVKRNSRKAWIGALATVI